MLIHQTQHFAMNPPAALLLGLCSFTAAVFCSRMGLNKNVKVSFFRCLWFAFLFMIPSAVMFKCIAVFTNSSWVAISILTVAGMVGTLLPRSERPIENIQTR